MIDTRLISDRFDSLHQAAEAGKAAEQKKADIHNEQVDAELARERTAPPSTPSGGSAPAAAEKAEKAPDDFAGAINEILYGGNK